LANLKAVRSVGAGEASAFAEVAASGTVASGETVAAGAGAGAGVGVAAAGGAGVTDWAGEEGSRLLIRQKGEDRALLRDLCVGAGKDKLLGVPASKDFIQDNRLFFCAGNDVLRLLVGFLPLLLSNNCTEGELC
jgi:hypothetical protein